MDIEQKLRDLNKSLAQTTTSVLAPIVCMAKELTRQRDTAQAQLAEVYRSVCYANSGALHACMNEQTTMIEQLKAQVEGLKHALADATAVINEPRWFIPNQHSMKFYVQVELGRMQALEAFEKRIPIQVETIEGLNKQVAAKMDIIRQQQIEIDRLRGVEPFYYVSRTDFDLNIKQRDTLIATLKAEIACLRGLWNIPFNEGVEAAARYADSKGWPQTSKQLRALKVGAL